MWPGGEGSPGQRFHHLMLTVKSPTFRWQPVLTWAEASSVLAGEAGVGVEWGTQDRCPVRFLVLLVVSRRKSCPYCREAENWVYCSLSVPGLYYAGSCISPSSFLSERLFSLSLKRVSKCLRIF